VRKNVIGRRTPPLSGTWSDVGFVPMTNVMRKSCLTDEQIIGRSGVDKK
jgi:hypothetical protein